jgi:hypothetical protein
MSSAYSQGSDREHSKTFRAASWRTEARARVRGKWLFLSAFIFACFLFWWLRSILCRVVFHLPDSVDDSTIEISLLALLLFVAGYLIPTIGRPPPWISEAMLDACGDFAYKTTAIVFLLALPIAVLVWYSRLGKGYFGVIIPFFGQAVLYTHLFFGFIYLGAADPERDGWKRIWNVSILLTLPRLIISLNGGRFFLAQAVVPALLIAVARGWIRPSFKRMLQIAALALVIIFVPAMTRGDELVGPDHDLQIFMSSDVLGLFQNNTDLSLNGNCPPLLISLTAKVIPYGAMGVCVVDTAGLKNVPATLEHILTNNEPGSFSGTATGTGSNYILELYLSGGLLAVYIGSALFGFSCLCFVCWIGRRSLFSGIWAECLTRALLAPRGNLGYVYERIPSLVVATLFTVLIIWAWRLLKRELLNQSTGDNRTLEGKAR